MEDWTKSCVGVFGRIFDEALPKSSTHVLENYFKNDHATLCSVLQNLRLGSIYLAQVWNSVGWKRLPKKTIESRRMPLVPDFQTISILNISSKVSTTTPGWNIWRKVRNGDCLKIGDEWHTSDRERFRRSNIMLPKRRCWTPAQQACATRPRLLDNLHFEHFDKSVNHKCRLKYLSKCSKCMLPKRRFWKIEQSVACAFLKSFSRAWVLDLGDAYTMCGWFKAILKVSRSVYACCSW